MTVKLPRNTEVPVILIIRNNRLCMTGILIAYPEAFLYKHKVDFDRRGDNAINLAAYFEASAQTTNDGTKPFNFLGNALDTIRAGLVYEKNPAALFIENLAGSCS